MSFPTRHELLSPTSWFFWSLTVKNSTKSLNFVINEIPMVQDRECIENGKATSVPNQAPIVSYVLLKMCEAAHCRPGTQFLGELQVWLFLFDGFPHLHISIVDSKHLSWLYKIHLSNLNKLTAWSFFDETYLLIWTVLFHDTWIMIIFDERYCWQFVFLCQWWFVSQVSVALRLKCVW